MSEENVPGSKYVNVPAKLKPGDGGDINIKIIIILIVTECNYLSSC
jgi:hypothetical protein